MASLEKTAYSAIQKAGIGRFSPNPLTRQYPVHQIDHGASDSSQSGLPRLALFRYWYFHRTQPYSMQRMTDHYTLIDASKLGNILS
jgi:hypothetical protein